MNKKIILGLLLVTICVATFSCKKSKTSTTDPTLNYFPIKFGHYVTYSVDSVYYIGQNGTESLSSGPIDTCVKVEIKSQMKYAIDDTFRDASDRLSYIMDVYTRPYDGGFWIGSYVILITPTQTTITNLADPITQSLLYTQDGTRYVKLMFPISNGFSWQGNQYAQVNNPTFSYLKNWNYTYKNYHLSYFNGQINFDNTVTVLEDDENVNYPNVDSGVAGYRTFAEEVYAYNVGMVYKEWTHYTWNANDAGCWNGYSVIMRAIDYN